MGRAGLERQYEWVLRGKEGSRFCRSGRRVGRTRNCAGGSTSDRTPEMIPRCTNIDLDLQRFAAGCSATRCQGGVVALDPATGAVLALRSAPSYDPNAFIGGISRAAYALLCATIPGRRCTTRRSGDGSAGVDLQAGHRGHCHAAGARGARRPDAAAVHGGALFGRATSGAGEEEGARLVDAGAGHRKNPATSTSTSWACASGSTASWPGGRGAFGNATGIDLPDETTPGWPEAAAYFNRKYGRGGWTNAVTLNLAIGQERPDVGVNMARFHTALATDGQIVRPSVVQRPMERDRCSTCRRNRWPGCARRCTVISTTVPRPARPSRAWKSPERPGRARTRRAKDHGWFVGFALKRRSQDRGRGGAPLRRARLLRRPNRHPDD